MSFIRSLLADLRIAFVPKIGVAYRYESEGPFQLGPIFIPREIKSGFVRYEMVRNDSVGELACSISAFASCYKEIKNQPKEIVPALGVVECATIAGNNAEASQKS